jgi:dTDP-glucose 4,6-dehydratase
MRKLNKILVTGGCGFIGWNFIRHVMSKERFQITNIDKLTYASKKNLMGSKNSKRYKFYKKDINSKKNISKIFSKNNIDAVVHFAAETHVDNSINSPEIFIKTNVIGTYNLLNESLKYIKKNKKKNFIFIHISTDEVFGHLKKKDKPFSEKTKYSPRNPYSASKAAADHLVRSYISTYNFPAIILNCCNNYGPFQNDEKFIPKILTNILKKKEIPIYGKGKNIREWIFVNDFARAILLILKKGKIGENYNVGSGKELTNINLALLLCEVMDKKLKLKEKSKKLISFVKDRAGHDFRYAINSNKIRNQLKWKPTTPIKEGLEKTINYYINKEQNKTTFVYKKH